MSRGPDGHGRSDSEDPWSELDHDLAFAFSSISFALDRVGIEATDSDDAQLSAFGSRVRGLAEELLTLVQHLEGTPRQEWLTGQVDFIVGLHQEAANGVPISLSTAEAKDAVDTVLKAYTELVLLIRRRPALEQLFEAHPRLVALTETHKTESAGTSSEVTHDQSASHASAVGDQSSVFCTNCGRQVGAGDKFCRDCGAPILENPLTVQNEKMATPIQPGGRSTRLSLRDRALEEYRRQNADSTPTLIRERGLAEYRIRIAAAESSAQVVPPRINSTRRRSILLAAIAVGVIAAALLGTTGWLQSSYPGGVVQWTKDLSGPSALSELDLQASVRRAMVTTLAPHWHSNLISQGSAFFFEDSTEVVTADHVLPNPLVQLVVVDGFGDQHPAEVLGRDSTDDAAVLRVQGVAPLPLQPTVHPLYPMSKVYMGGNPGASAPGTVVSGVVVSTDYSTTVEGEPVRHTILVSGGPIGPGMSGGPVVDMWGRVVGLIKAATADGAHIIVVPLSSFGAMAASEDANGQPMYIGPPLIESDLATLILGPSTFGNRGAHQDRNEIHWRQGNPSTWGYDEGDLWLGWFSTIADAKSRISQDVASESSKWRGGTTQATGVGDGGWLLVFRDAYGFTLLEEIWSERNVVVEWWIETLGWDESKLFAYVIGQQEAQLWGA